MPESSGLPLSSMRAQCSGAEWKTRVDLAACYRLVELYGMSDMMANHISARVPGEHGAFLINAYGMLYEEITASSLIKVDFDGKVLSTPDFGPLGYGVNQAGYVIHSAVHAARPEVDCVIHAHTWASMAVSSLEYGLVAGGGRAHCHQRSPLPSLSRRRPLERPIARTHRRTVAPASGVRPARRNPQWAGSCG